MKKILFLAVAVVLAACSNDPVNLDENVTGQPEASIAAAGDPYSVSVTGGTFSGVFVIANSQTECRVTLKQNSGVVLGTSTTISFSQIDYSNGYVFTYGAGAPGVDILQGNSIWSNGVPYSGKTFNGNNGQFEIRFTPRARTTGYINITTGSLTQSIMVYVM